ncbi:MAG: hypothetical protein DYG90_12505 [Chloroflexi bacterium CFX6]|nr:hypothetical protein [Chloroflexi bacterium CFX6]
MKHWHALYTKPRMEARVADTLEARGIEVFAPLVLYHGKRGTLLDKPLFPRYVLARFDWEHDGRAGVQWTPGLTRVVSFDGRPAWLEDAEVAYLRSRLAELDGDTFVRIKPGQRVRVKHGPFRDFEAVFDGYLNGAARVAILLDILGRRTRVHLGECEIAQIA